MERGHEPQPTTKNDGDDVIVTGKHGPTVFIDYSKHPFEDGGEVEVRPGLFSTAAGRYQLLARYWVVFKAQLHLPDSSPASLDELAIQQIKEREALVLIETGNIAGAITACSNIWTSFPRNNYAQGCHTLAALIAKYQTLPA
jgi:muramidase (phage lysozyme)